MEHAAIGMVGITTLSLFCNSRTCSEASRLFSLPSSSYQRDDAVHMATTHMKSLTMIRTGVWFYTAVRGRYGYRKNNLLDIARASVGSYVYSNRVTGYAQGSLRFITPCLS